MQAALALVASSYEDASRSGRAAHSVSLGGARSPSRSPLRGTGLLPGDRDWVAYPAGAKEQ